MNMDKIKGIYNKVGSHCMTGLILCEHNLSDASINPRQSCSGIGGKCIDGDKFAFEPKDKNETLEKE